MAERASAMSSPQKFCVQRALVLTAGEYRFYTEKDFREPFFGIHRQGPCPEFDVQTKTWNCVLVVSETGKDGVLVSKESDADRYYVAYVPEHSKLDLRADLPVRTVLLYLICELTLKNRPKSAQSRRIGLLCLLLCFCCAA